MLVQKLKACVEFIAGDGTQLRELLHPDKQRIELRYSLAHATVPVGQTSIPHSLKTSEVYYILSGTGEMHIEDETQILEPGDTVYIPPNARQFIHNFGTEPLIFICIVDPAWTKEDETVYEASSG
jgi:mannose-6-phosphate isomerase-like protein (cupin superfamily)